ncbi:acylphosphatase-2 isoform X2 [Rattus norvegicus]|uniref:acylphosphatase-2 isoform X2 n=1 Tax=Rattus norvegicus TaxID=10116 RepID=UPI002FD87448
MSLLRLASVALSAPHTPLRLLARGLAAMAEPLKSVDYEVFGTVQGVCFRMYTEGEAKKRGLVGWVKNTSKGTVTGQVQGPEEKVNSMYFFRNTEAAFTAPLLPPFLPENLETTQMSHDRRMDTENVVHLHNGILLSY